MYVELGELAVDRSKLASCTRRILPAYAHPIIGLSCSVESNTPYLTLVYLLSGVYAGKIWCVHVGKDYVYESSIHVNSDNRLRTKRSIILVTMMYRSRLNPQFCCHYYGEDVVNADV